MQSFLLQQILIYCVMSWNLGTTEVSVCHLSTLEQYKKRLKTLKENYQKYMDPETKGKQPRVYPKRCFERKITTANIRIETHENRQIPKLILRYHLFLLHINGLVNCIQCIVY